MWFHATYNKPRSRRMELSALTLRVLLLFFPGVLCAMLVDALTVHRERTPVQFLTHSFVLGMGSYLLLNAVREFCATAAGLIGIRPPLPVTFFDALVNEKARIAWREIALAALLSVPLAGAVSAVLNHRLFHRLGRKVRLSKRFGDLDVWGFVFNSPRLGWIVVRDLGHGLTYQGWVEAFSDTAQPAELFLRDVTVFNSTTGAKLYEAARVYFARPIETLAIETSQEPRSSPGSRGEDATSRESVVARGEGVQGRSERASHDAPAQHSPGTTGTVDSTGSDGKRS